MTKEGYEKTRVGNMDMENNGKNCLDRPENKRTCRCFRDAGRKLSIIIMKKYFKK